MYSAIDQIIKDGRERLANSNQAVVEAMQSTPQAVVEMIGMIYVVEVLERIKKTMH